MNYADNTYHFRQNSFSLSYFGIDFPSFTAIIYDMEDLCEIWVGYNVEQRSTRFGLKSLGMAKKLLPGHVVIIELGIYFVPNLNNVFTK